MSNNRIAEASRWLKQAQYDLQAVGWNIQGGFYDTACFLSQQAGEKVLKSLLYYLGARREVLLTHSLVEMVQESRKYSVALLNVLDEARELDLHYVPSRYPNGLPSGFPHQFYGLSMAEQAFTAAQKIFDAVKNFYQTEGKLNLFDSSP